MTEQQYRNAERAAQLNVRLDELDRCLRAMEESDDVDEAQYCATEDAFFAALLNLRELEHR